MTTFEIVIKVISCITPFALLIMGWVYTSAIRKRDKREDANKKLEEEKKAAERKAKLEHAMGLDQTFESPMAAAFRKAKSKKATE